jgi:hypothetical protein
MRKLSPFVLAVTAAVLVVFAVHFLDFPGSVPRFKEVSGGGTLFDASPAFTVGELYQRLTDFGENGRRSYRSRNVTVDVLLPLSLLPFLCMLMLKAVKPLRLNRFVRLSLLGLPLAYVILDLAENAAVLVLLNNYPERMELLAAILPIITLSKRAASLLALVVPLAMIGIRLLRTKLPNAREEGSAAVVLEKTSG